MCRRSRLPWMSLLISLDRIYWLLNPIYRICSSPLLSMGTCTSPNSRLSATKNDVEDIVPVLPCQDECKKLMKLKVLFIQGLGYNVSFFKSQRPVFCHHFPSEAFCFWVWGTSYPTPQCCDNNLIYVLCQHGTESCCAARMLAAERLCIARMVHQNVKRRLAD